MKLIKHLMGLPVLLFCITSFGQISNTANTVTLNVATSDGCTVMPAGSYQMDLSYTDVGNGSTISYTSVAVTISVVNSTTYTIDASSASPAVAFPYNNGNDFILTTGMIKLVGNGLTRIIYWQYEFLTCSALPIVMTNFKGQVSSSSPYSIALTWDTQSESNSAYFDVMRSLDGANWVKIGRVSAAGNSSTTLHYSYTDYRPGPQNYYRLRMVDQDGTCATSPYIRRTCNCTYTAPSPVVCNFSINGPDIICNSAPVTYQLSSLPPNYSNIVWSVSPSYDAGVTVNSCDDSKAQVTNNVSQEVITLTASMSGCTYGASKTIALGPGPGGTYYNGGSWHPLYTDQQVQSGETDISFPCPTCTDVQWTRTYGTASYWTPSPNTLYFWISPGDYVEFTVTGSNACGPFNRYFDFDSYGSFAAFTASPNPAASTISVTQRTAPATASKTAATRLAIRQIQLYDNMGNLRKTVPGNGVGNKLDVDVSNLPTGYYLLRISYGNNKFETKHVRVQH